jgi:hypothetical protein
MDHIIQRYKEEVLDEMSKHFNAMLACEVERILSNVSVALAVEAGCFQGQSPVCVAEEIMREREGRLYCGGKE